MWYFTVATRLILQISYLIRFYMFCFLYLYFISCSDSLISCCVALVVIL